MPNKDALRRWAEKLESDMFPQGSGFLKSEDVDTHENIEWCCIGVACKQAVDDGHPLDVATEKAWRDTGRDVELSITTEWRDDSIENYGFGPASLGDYFGIPHDLRNASNRNSHGLGKYIGMNDNGKTFRAIASEIRKDFDL